MSESYDATWYDYVQPASHSHSVQGGYSYTFGSSTNAAIFNTLTYSPADIRATEATMRAALKEELSPKKKTPKPPSDKESEDVASNHTFSHEDRDDIDDAVRAAIIEPRKAAEIARRKAALEALGTEDNYPVGTVITFKRKHNKNEYLHVAVKTDEEKWFAAGYLFTNSSRSYDDLLTWMTTGENIVSDVQIATAFDPISWDDAPVVPAQTPVTI